MRCIRNRNDRFVLILPRDAKRNCYFTIILSRLVPLPVSFTPHLTSIVIFI
jgi:hypothetical protein